VNTDEIVGFPEPCAEGSLHDDRAMPSARFDLVDELRRVKGAEITRILEIAEQLLLHCGPVVAIGFMHCEILGRLPHGADGAGHIERLRRAPSAALEIIEELRTLADAETRNPGQPL
jgi:hypothetical protein